MLAVARPAPLRAAAIKAPRGYRSFDADQSWETLQRSRTKRRSNNISGSGLTNGINAAAKNSHLETRTDCRSVTGLGSVVIALREIPATAARARREREPVSVFPPAVIDGQRSPGMAACLELDVEEVRFSDAV